MATDRRCYSLQANLKQPYMCFLGFHCPSGPGQSRISHWIVIFIITAIPSQVNTSHVIPASVHKCVLSNLVRESHHGHILHVSRPNRESYPSGKKHQTMSISWIQRNLTMVHHFYFWWGFNVDPFCLDFSSAFLAEALAINLCHARLT